MPHGQGGILLVAVDRLLREIIRGHEVEVWVEERPGRRETESILWYRLLILLYGLRKLVVVEHVGERHRPVYP